MDRVPTIELVGLTAVQKKALRIADNKIALNAGWDLEILKLELSDIEMLDVDFNLTRTGFTSGELDVALGMCRVQFEWSADNAIETLKLLRFISVGNSETERTHNQFKIETWAAQAALSRPGTRWNGQLRLVDINAMVLDPGTLRWAGKDQ